ncbi:MAG: polymer-forming cytoskeletal protein [Candidatus Kerfeldbacteria bacterium]|nr:polymer-forming cytoskeletal protein [Candidatus Kerfeldbacteria bacterium]
MKLRHAAILFGFLVMGIALLPQTSQALSISTEEQITIAKDETIDDNLFAAGDQITINGTVNGDVYAFGSTITINGTVNGDVISGAGTLEINGPVAGNVRAGGQRISINAPVGKNVTVAGETITLDDEATIGWSIIAGGRTLQLNGPIGGNVSLAGEAVSISNTIGSNVDVTLGEKGRITLGDSAVINGDFTYRGTQAANVSTAAVITGNTVHRQFNANLEFDKDFFTRAWILSELIGLFGLLLVGTIVVSIASERIESTMKRMQVEPVIIMLWGLLLFIAVPILSVIAMMTLIGLPLGLISLGCYLLAIYLSKIFVGTLLGTWLLNRNGKTTPFIWRMMLGTLIVVALANIPTIGWTVSLVSSIWFLGTLWVILTKRTPSSKK